MGYSPNHIIVYILWVILLQTLGIIWEIVEYIIDKNRIVLKYIGGCMGCVINNLEGNIIDANTKKKYNIIDRIFGIKIQINIYGIIWLLRC